MLCSRCRTHILSRLSFSGPSSNRISPRIIGLISNPRQRPYSTPGESAQADTSKEQSSEDVKATTAKTGATVPSASRVKSSVPAGTRLLGLNYFKNKPEILAMHDSEYPDWLWELVDGPGAKSAKSGAGNVDVSSMNKKQRARHEKKMAAIAASKPRTIPLHEQTIDIVPTDAITADAEKNFEVASTGIEDRKAITKSARSARRKSIKESNFLKGL